MGEWPEVGPIEEHFRAGSARGRLYKKEHRTHAQAPLPPQLQAFFLVADDIMDASVTRRGSPCWYKLPHVGMIAINDSYILQSQMYRMLKKHFGSTTIYAAILDIFLETTWRTELGQNLDLTSSPMPGTGKEVDLERFTLERYQLIVRNKTAYYSFNLPVVAGLILAGHGDAAKAPQIEDILVRMGEYFQVQDDYLDCYADAEVLGKIGTDIQDSKCSWLVVQALSLCNAEQRTLLKSNYGKHDNDCIAAVKSLYADLKLEDLFLKYESTSYAEIRGLIDSVSVSTSIPSSVFNALLTKIYKRAK
jgi:farnesyl diphosphate synthase